MQYAKLGRTGLKVSRLCLGTMNFGPHASEKESFAIMDRALELGINLFDTANVYGWKKGEGVTEKILGAWFAQGGGRREKVVLATKVYGEMGDWPNSSKLSAFHIRRACEDSLKRMQTDHVDLYQMHHVWRDAPWDEVWQAMELLVAQGKVVYVGSSNFAGWQIAQASETARARHFLGLVAEQSLYNLNARMVELEVLPAARRTAWACSRGARSQAGCSEARSRRRRKEGAARRRRRRTSRSTARSSSPGRSSAATSGRRRRASRSPGCSRTRP
jgi:aryl-alcohol dehydrogenase-like predicted oxidoreductase